MPVSVWPGVSVVDLPSRWHELQLPLPLNRLSLAYYRAMPRNLASRATWELLFTPIKVPARMIRGADDGCIGPEMFEGQERLFAGGFELITLQGAGHFMHCEQPEAFCAVGT